MHNMLLQKSFVFLIFLFVISCGTIPVPGRVDGSELTDSKVVAESAAVQKAESSELQNNDVGNSGNESGNESDVSINNSISEKISDTKPESTQAAIEHREPEVLTASQSLEKSVTLPENNKIKPVATVKSDREIKYGQAKDNYNSGKYPGAITILETLNLQFKENLKYRDLLVLSYTKYANFLETKADLLEAQTILEKAISIQPYNRDLLRQLKDLENRREADRQYGFGVLALNSGDRDYAIDAFYKAIELKPEHELANKQLALLRTQYVETYQKKAMTLYRKQALDEAIKVWARVLALDPDNEMAKLYRARAIELKVKLDRF